MPELLLLGCSSRKTDTPEPTPAVYRYDGPFYQDFRAHLREHEWSSSLDVAVLSAEFGLIGSLTEIKNYDRRMTPERAAELAPAVSDQMTLWSRKYDRIRLCLGKDYLSALPVGDLVKAGKATVFEGPIGLKRQQLGRFVRGLSGPQRRRNRTIPSGRLAYYLPDWDDLIDPNFDFENDAFSAAKSDRGEKHCARFMRPYKIADGILVSLAQKRESKGPLKFVGGLDQRTLRPIDLRQHYGLDSHQSLFGDCGAFSYVNEVRPPISVQHAVSLYDLYNFDMAASVDHIPVPQIVIDGARVDLSLWQRKRRVQLTIDNADAFLTEAKHRRVAFTPVGTVQGMSPKDYVSNSMAYVEMGYERIALGGLVPQSDEALKDVVTAVMTSLRSLKRAPEVHLFGVFRPRLQPLFHQLGIRSFDSATYFRKAWLRSEQNYLGTNGQWYAAIRVPMTSDGRTRNQLLQSGKDISSLEILEEAALAALHAYAGGKQSLKATLAAVLEYDLTLARSSEDIDGLKERYRRTLADRPWAECACPICRDAGIDVLIFRGSNRNKRRGAHNTWRLYTSVKAQPLTHGRG